MTADVTSDTAGTAHHTQHIYRERDVAILARIRTAPGATPSVVSVMTEKFIAALRESIKKYGEVKACSLEVLFCF